jgi:hypothetical protein
VPNTHAAEIRRQWQEIRAHNAATRARHLELLTRLLPQLDRATDLLQNAADGMSPSTLRTDQ